jgi:hypothetical protein
MFKTINMRKFLDNSAQHLENLIRTQKIHFLKQNIFERFGESTHGVKKTDKELINDFPWDAQRGTSLSGISRYFSMI